MTTTSTYAFNPSSADVVLNAYGMLQIRRTELQTAHLEDAAFQFNMLMADIGNRQPNWWTLETQTQTLRESTANYALAARTISVAIAYLSTTSGGTTTDRVIAPLAAADYAAMPNKAQEAAPTSYWFSRTDPPSVTVWPTPDAATVALSGTLKMMTFRQCMDVDLSSGYTLDSPHRFLDAITTGLAARLAEYYRPEKEQKLNQRFEERLARAARQDQENVPMRISMNISSYYR